MTNVKELMRALTCERMGTPSLPRERQSDHEDKASKRTPVHAYHACYHHIAPHRTAPHHTTPHHSRRKGCFSWSSSCPLQERQSDDEDAVSEGVETNGMNGTSAGDRAFVAGASDSDVGEDSLEYRFA